MHNEEGIGIGEMQEILKKARETYGDKNQLLVSIEELNELACVLAKYPRYDDRDKATKDLYDKTLDEVADVYTVLEHIKSICGITEEALWRRRQAKVSRLKRWLTHSDSMNETIVDREVTEDSEEVSCKGCKISLHFNGEMYENKCRPCLQAQATEGRAPYKE